MNRMQMKAELVEFFGRWWNGGSRENSPFLGEKTFELMADAALAVLFAIADVEKFYQREKMLK